MPPACSPSAGCRYYGQSHAVYRLTGRLISQGGNECALMFDSFAPCKMERLGYRPDATRCPIARGHERSKALPADATVVTVVPQGSTT